VYSERLQEHLNPVSFPDGGEGRVKGLPDSPTGEGSVKGPHKALSSSLSLSAWESWDLNCSGDVPIADLSIQWRRCRHRRGGDRDRCHAYSYEHGSGEQQWELGTTVGLCGLSVAEKEP
jgi:hypothetical protein